MERFLHTNGCIRVYRAHQICQEGYNEMFGGKLATVWSAPNYCFRFENLASICELDEQLNSYFNIFEDSPENKKKKENGDVGGMVSRSTTSNSNSTGSTQRMRNIHQLDDFFLWADLYEYVSSTDLGLLTFKKWGNPSWYDSQIPKRSQNIIIFIYI